MAFFEGADWIVAVGVVFGGAATLLGAWLTQRRPPAEVEDERPPAIVRLHDDDRELLLKLKDTLFRCATRFEQAAASLSRTIDDNSAEIRRNRPE